MGINTIGYGNHEILSSLRSKEGKKAKIEDFWDLSNPHLDVMEEAP